MSVDDQPVQNRLTEAIVRYRAVFFVLIGLLFLVSFNGEWRVGRDSAIYRGLGANIAAGNGYTFGEFGSRQVYPGLPLMLAGLERLFGPTPVAPQLVILAMAATTMVLTYRLIAMHYPHWMAVCVTCGVGVNARFLQLSHEIMTDVPFLLGVVASLYGLERLRIASDPPARVKGGLILLIGLALAASMRPTFWILAMAWVGMSLWGMVRGPRRLYSFSLGILLVVAVAKFSLDPRTDGFSPLEGGYEREAVSMLAHAGENMRAQIPRLLERHLPSAFFGQFMLPGVSTLLSLLIIGSAFLLMRRNLLWGLLVLLTIPPTLLLSTVPRYYLMVLPLMLLAWLLMLNWIIRRLPPRWGETLLLCGLAIVTLPNLARGVKIVYEQRRVPFIEHYDKGHWVPIIEMADHIREHVPPDAKVIGPEWSVLSYYSGRRVLMQREIFAGASEEESPARLAASGVEYAVFPAGAYRKDRIFARMIRHRVLRPVETVVRIEQMYLARCAVTVPQAPADPPPDPVASGDGGH